MEKIETEIVSTSEGVRQEEKAEAEGSAGKEGVGICSF